MLPWPAQQVIEFAKHTDNQIRVNHHLTLGNVLHGTRHYLLL